MELPKELMVSVSGVRGRVGEALTPVTARAHVFVADLDRPRLTAEDHHHLTRVLRLAPGAGVTACDGRGSWRPCTLAEGEALAAIGPATTEARPTPPLTVGFALVKGQRPDLVVQKLTELGIDRIVPFVADRSVVRWDAAKSARQAARHADIARHAAMQCRRTWLPEVPPVSSFAAVAGIEGATLADRSGTPPTPGTRTVLIGPEGGWSDGERAAGLAAVRLARHVLRAETAAITAGAVMAALRDGLVRSGR